jgi:tRNA (guanine26-N2/guanine27-N2)-dimethyltransferase
LAISGPLWIGPLQDSALLAELAVQPSGESLSEAGARLLARLAADPGAPACCWPTAEIARRLGCGPPPLAELVAGLRTQGWEALASGVMPGQFRSDAPWPVILQIARQLAETAAVAAK